MLRVNEKGRGIIAFKRSYLVSLFCFIAGIMLLIITVQSKYVPPHLALLGILDIIASYSITVKRRWALCLTLLVSLVSLIFGSITLTVLIMFFGFGLDLMELLVLSAITLYTALFVYLIIYLVSNMRSFS